MSNQTEKDNAAVAIESELEKQAEETAEAASEQKATEDTDVKDQKIGKFKTRRNYYGRTASLRRNLHAARRS